ncbi:twin-arginine translocation signal domain-containing protein [Prosthecobacter sp.]|uniref:twin-arginine translocation signal domain-containing protein n=1 Tax=Prosthecobacter sp. TaxID=1965333 RepID=UPI0037CB434B
MPSRRRFLQACSAATLPCLGLSAAESTKPFSFILLGDLYCAAIHAGSQSGAFQTLKISV